MIFFFGERIKSLHFLFAIHLLPVVGKDKRSSSYVSQEIQYCSLQKVVYSKGELFRR